MTVSIEQRKLSIRAIQLLGEHEIRTETGRIALHNAAYFDGMHGKDPDLVWAAEDIGSDFHEIVKPAFEDGRAQNPDRG